MNKEGIQNSFFAEDLADESTDTDGIKLNYWFNDERDIHMYNKL